MDGCATLLFDQQVKPRVGGQGIPQDLMSFFSLASLLFDEVGRHHAAYAGHFRRDGYFPNPTQVLVRYYVGVESGSLGADRRFEVAPQAHFFLAVLNLWNLELPRQQPRAQPGSIDEPAGFDALSTHRTNRCDLLAGAFNFGNAIP